MAEPLVTIVVPNWNTGELLRVCLTSIRRNTEVPHRLVVVDNGSADASRRFAEAAAAEGWLELVRRDDDGAEGAASHGGALDAGLEAAATPYLFTLDSDAWARRRGWLGRYLQALMAVDGSHAGATKFPSGRVNRLGAWLTRRRPGPEARYVRPCHALYRVDLLRRHALSFAPVQGEDGRWRTTGERLHERLVSLGYRPALLAHDEVAGLVGHVRHATMVLNAQQFPALRERTRRRGERRIRSFLRSPEVQGILGPPPDEATGGDLATPLAAWEDSSP